MKYSLNILTIHYVYANIIVRYCIVAIHISQKQIIYSSNYWNAIQFMDKEIIRCMNLRHGNIQLHTTALHNASETTAANGFSWLWYAALVEKQVILSQNIGEIQVIQLTQQNNTYYRYHHHHHPSSILDCCIHALFH